ncbi:cellulose-binding domain-containing protein [Myceligenerans crystallogenes]|uniref:CBM2 domain-containing protein n=1 Tax=Myceligenerans crystallogenes TaxID=316335 RepID=A0ABN2NNP2_9MICO
MNVARSPRPPTLPGRTGSTSRTRAAHGRRVLAALGAAVSLLAAGAVTAMTAPAATAATGCSVQYSVVNTWQGGYQANVSVTNLGDALSSWTLAWTFASGQGVSQAWNATVTQSGTQVTARNVSWNGGLATGQSASFGFIGSGASSPAPGGFTLNGVACTGQVGGGTPSSSPATPSSTPTTSPTPSPDPTTPGSTPTTPAGGGEFDGAGCDVSGDGPGSDSRLPDPFLGLNGTRIDQKSDWRCRRAEIKKLAENTIYGAKPGKPERVTGTVTSSNITVNVSHQGRSSSFSASVQTPGGTGPFPAVIVYGGFGADTSTITGQGVAVISYDPTKVGAEGTSRGNKQGAFYGIYGANSSTGLLAAWGWGASRIIDVVEAAGGAVLRTDSFGVTGCSRYGKGAFVAGAFDQRIDLTMPIESGGGGSPILRGLASEAGAQSPSSSYGEQPWLGDAFAGYQNNTSGLPVDTHSVIGMIAPRGLFIMENPHVDWLGARSGANAALAGREIYAALGVQPNISYISNVSDGTHCATRSEWRTPLQQNLQAFLKGSGSAPGVFQVSSSKPGNLSQWRTWTTPSLS